MRLSHAAAPAVKSAQREVPTFPAARDRLGTPVRLATDAQPTDDAHVSDLEQRTVAFIDLAGFTTMTSAHGDETAATVAERFAAMASEELRDGEILVKSMGDAVMLVAPSASAGLHLAARICARADAEPAFPSLRTGLHHGPVVHSNGDWFGTTVNTAARIAARAAGGQVLGTQPIAEAAAKLGSAGTSLGPVPLRGLPEPVELFELVPCPALPRRFADPVCRMALEEPNAVARIRHAGREFLFCSLDCAASFALAPGRYAGVVQADGASLMSEDAPPHMSTARAFSYVTAAFVGAIALYLAVLVLVPRIF